MRLGNISGTDRIYLDINCPGLIDLLAKEESREPASRFMETPWREIKLELTQYVFHGLSLPSLVRGEKKREREPLPMIAYIYVCIHDELIRSKSSFS